MNTSSTDYNTPNTGSGKLGNTVMRQLFLARKHIDKLKGVGNVSEPREYKSIGSATPRMNILRRPGPSAPVFPVNEPETTKPVKLLNKQSSDPIGSYTLNELNTAFKDKMKSPLLTSLAVSAPVGLGMWAVDKFINPDNPAKNKNIMPIANQLAQADGGRHNFEYYLDKAIAKNKRRRNLKSVLSALAAFAGMEWAQYTKGHPESLYTYNLKKNASMFGAGVPSVLPVSTVKEAVYNNPNLLPSYKQNAMRMLGTFNKNEMVTPPSIVGQSVRTGFSGATGMPLGRLAISSVADAATGYGLGHLLGVGNPTRLGMLTGGLSLLSRI